ncbi:hypothetical protein [Shinella sp.]|uniref:hypothetical protein n=1 Tax=Shinella sp. TaxID=1870904 RepID=UPI00289A0E14|nr:hypothetical protein [Shinella sp.]
MTDTFLHDDPALDWDDIDEELALLESSEPDDAIWIDWETIRHVPGWSGNDPRAVVKVRGTPYAWHPRHEEQWRLDVADATCRPTLVR